MDDLYFQDTFSRGVAEPESDEIQRFELLRNELMELEKRVQDQSDNEEVPFSVSIRSLIIFPSTFFFWCVV